MLVFFPHQRLEFLLVFLVSLLGVDFAPNFTSCTQIVSLGYQVGKVWAHPRNLVLLLGNFCWYVVVAAVSHGKFEGVPNFIWLVNNFHQMLYDLLKLVPEAGPVGLAIERDFTRLLSDGASFLGKFHHWYIMIADYRDNQCFKHEVQCVVWIAPGWLLD